MNITTNRQAGFNKVVIVVLVFVLVVALVFSAYFFAWRPADKDYQQAADITQSLRSETNIIYGYTSLAKYPGLLGDSVVSKLESAITAHEKAIDDLAVTAAITRDASLKSNYEDVKNAANTYRNAASEVVSLLKLYRSVVVECGVLTDDVKSIETTAAFDEASKDCLAAINKGEQIDNTNFKQQFFTDYLSSTKELVSAIKDTVNDPSTQPAADQAAKKIADMGKVVIDYKLPSNPMREIDSLITKIDGQKSAFFR